MDSILHILVTYGIPVLAVVLVLGGLIFFHELGHFIANRIMGIGVVTFSLGMGPRLWGFKRGKTDYRLSWFPIGGYVAAVGEYSDEVEELGFTPEEAVSNRPAWQRLILAFAGPFANLLLAWLIYWGVTFATGLAVTLPVVGGVMADSAAQEAGLGLIVAGHAETEQVVLPKVAASLQTALDAVQCKLPVIYEKDSAVTRRTL